MFFLPEAQNVVYDDPRFKAFEDSNHFLNTAVLQTQGPVPGLEPQVRRAFAQVNPDLPVIDFMSFADQVDGNFSQNQMLAKLTSLFGHATSGLRFRYCELLHHENRSRDG